MLPVPALLDTQHYKTDLVSLFIEAFIQIVNTVLNYIGDHSTKA